ncbi:MAG: hypothetical protein V4628_05550 [Pseudomonadota bacterium]
MYQTVSLAIKRKPPQPIPTRFKANNTTLADDFCSDILPKMNVTLFPNPRRPGFGLRPKIEAQRPLLPQHARLCPVLEAGSSLGALVYPSLAENEQIQIGYEGEGVYTFGYAVNPTGKKWEQVFTVTYRLAVGGIGMRREEVTAMIPETPGFKDTAKTIARMFIVPDDLGTPTGAVTLRGAYNFQTPPGWDTVYSSVLNMTERPIAPVLVIRVQTDWYVHDTEFRYILAPGETISASHSLPVGQVFFVPREEIKFVDGTEQEITERRKTSQEFFDEKAANKIKTPYGLEYSPHYQRTSRLHQKTGTGGVDEDNSGKNGGKKS